MNDATLLHRQVHPSWFQQGRITSQVFRPTPKDQSLLSVYDGDLISAENAWRHYTGTLGYVSVGVVAVTVAECGTHKLQVRPDPEPFPEHAVVDFTNLPESAIKTKSKLLKAAADARGWQYAAEVLP